MTTSTPEQLVSNVVSMGRAYVRLVESADVLLARNPVWTERLLLRMVRALYSQRLRQLVATVPPDLSGEILVASETMVGPVRDVSAN